MSKLQGRQFSVGIVKEAVRGTLVSTDATWYPHLNLTLQDKMERVRDEASLGVMARYEDSKLVRQWADGDIEGKIRDVDYGNFLRWLAGQASTTTTKAGETIVYKNIFTPLNSNNRGSFSVLVNSPISSSDEGYALGMLREMELNFDQNGYARFRAAVSAKKSQVVTVTPSFATQNEFVGRMCNVKIASNESGIAGATALKVRSLRITHSQDITPAWILGLVDPDDFINGTFETTFEMSLYYEDNSMRDLFLANTKQWMQVDLKDPGVSIGVGSNPELILDLPQVRFDYNRDLGLNDPATITVSGVAEYSLADLFDWRYTLYNTQNAYA